METLHSWRTHNKKKRDGRRGVQCLAGRRRRVNSIIDMYIRRHRRYIVATLFLHVLVSYSDNCCRPFDLSSYLTLTRHFPLFCTVCNKWGSKETRKSYKCLCSLANNTKCKRCISSSTLNALDRYSIGKMPNPMWRDWWGNFLDMSDIDADATDED